MKKTMRVLATLSILASSLLFAQPATAVENPYANGNGNVACINNGQESGYFVIASYKVTHQINCRGAAIVPTGVTELLANAFINTAITSIVIPNTVTSIGDYAFAEASALTSIVIPDSVTYLGNDVFKDARALTSATLGRTTQIGTSAFRRTGITSIVIPDSVTLINNGAFSGSALTSIIIPDSVTQINDYAFANSSSLQSVTIGEGVTYIKDAAFTGLSSLTSLIIGSNVNQMEGGSTFSGANALTTYTYCGSLSKSTLDSRSGWGVGKVNTCVPKATVTAGSEQNSKVATFASGIKLAEIPVSNALPAIKLVFTGTAPSSLIVKPISNPASLSATPFMTTNSPKIVDIVITGGHDGSDVKVCLDGASSDNLYHYTGEQWVELSGRTYENNQVCGRTNSFSPFVAAPVNPVAAPVNPVVATGVPSAPGSVVATTTGKRTATISFAAPASDGGSVITSYTVTSTPGSITKTLTQAGSGAFSVTGLQPGTSYIFSVTATNSIGISAAATSNTITTTAADVASLTAITFTDDGTGTAGKITWTGKNIDAVLYTGPANSYPGPFNFGAFSTSWNGTIRNLTPDTQYTISIFAISADGIGESKSLTFKTGSGVLTDAPITTAQVSSQLNQIISWVNQNSFVPGEAANINSLLTKFDALVTSAHRSYLKVPTSRVSKIEVKSLTPKACSVVSATAKVDSGLVTALTKDTCTISYTVSGASRAWATFVKDFTFRKVSK